jgi:transposase
MPRSSARSSQPELTGYSRAALLLYAYAKGNRSSRGIERACQEDVAYRVICANHAPDHSTIAEFAAATSRRSRTCSPRSSRSARPPA